jgi:NAD(P)-dependent dehydrogenase (short-subunit alcohol dehydrogenase family)
MNKLHPYGLSKALLNCYTVMLAKKYPNLIISAVSPGWVATRMTGNRGELTPEQGCLSARHCLL